MLDAILNLIPTVMGLGFIDENLDQLLNAMNNAPDFATSHILSIAKMVGCCLALGVGGNECYQMILGRRGMDVMKLLHIVLISFCISFSGYITSAAKAPGLALEKIAKEQVHAKAGSVTELQLDVLKKQGEYLKALVTRASTLDNKLDDQKESKKISLWEKVVGVGEEVAQTIIDTITAVIMTLEMGVLELLSVLIRYICEILFQISIYGLLCGQRCFLNILASFAPLMFAMSLSPHFKSAWSQWLSKYISISLWGFVCYICVYYALSIIQYNLNQDLAAYSKLLEDVGDIGGLDDNLGNIGVVGMQALGSTCMYVVGCLVGVKLLTMVPEVASWLIPGGVSSSAGSSMGGTGNTVATMGVSAAAGAAGGAAVSLASGTAGAVVNTAQYAANVANYQGTTQQAMDSSLKGSRSWTPNS